MNRMCWWIRAALAVRFLRWFAHAWPDQNARVGQALCELLDEINIALDREIARDRADRGRR